MARSACIGLVALAAACGPASPERGVQARVGEVPERGDALRVLLFSRTTGFRHDSIAVAVPALQQVGAARGWTVDATEDPLAFTPENLAVYDVVVFLLTTGDVLDEQQQQAFEQFVALGRGYVGVHSASDTEYDWPWYGEMLGGYFAGHPAPQQATVHVVDATHASTMHLTDPWIRFDEWYDFSPNPSATVDVLLRLDETTYEGGTMGDDHPIAWTHEHGGGRAFYTGGGHTGESWSEPEFLAHVEGGIAWAGASEQGESTSTGPAGSSGPDGSEGSTSLEPSTSDGTSNGAATSTASITGAMSSSTGTVPATDTDPEPASNDDGDSGCACTTTPRAPSLAWCLLLLAIRRGSARRSARSPAPASRAAPARTTPPSSRR